MCITPGVIRGFIGMLVLVLMIGSKRKTPIISVHGCIGRSKRMWILVSCEFGTFLRKHSIGLVPLAGQVDSFRIGSAQVSGAWWKGWLDEFRIGLFIETQIQYLHPIQIKIRMLVEAFHLLIPFKVLQLFCGIK